MIFWRVFFFDLILKNVIEALILPENYTRSEPQVGGVFRNHGKQGDQGRGGGGGRGG